MPTSATGPHLMNPARLSAQNTWQSTKKHRRDCRLHRRATFRLCLRGWNNATCEQQSLSLHPGARKTCSNATHGLHVGLSFLRTPKKPRQYIYIYIYICWRSFWFPVEANKEEHPQTQTRPGQLLPELRCQLFGAPQAASIVCSKLLGPPFRKCAIWFQDR